MDRKPVSLIIVATWIVALLGGVSDLQSATKHSEKAFGEPEEGRAVVYLIREAMNRGSARSMFVYAGGSLLGVVDNKSYTFGYLEPGEHILWTNWTKINETVDIEAGRTYYFNTTFDGFIYLDETIGKALVQRAKFYVTPTAKERATAERHIEERYGKATKLARESPEGDYVGTRGKRERHVAQWPQVDLSPYSILYIEDFRVTDPKAKKRKKGLMVETLPTRLADDVAHNVGGRVFEAVHREPAGSSVPGSVILRTDITQYKPGSKDARAIMPGVSKAHLDFTATLVDGQSGAQLARFDGKRTWGWGKGPGNEQRGIEEIEQNVAYELALYLRKCKSQGDR
ncbi:MAG: DUF2846 domain-containing protein [Acidobacteriota bacterium]